MLAIETAIKNLGYDKSEHLFRMSDIASRPELSFHDKKILQELKPYAFFVTGRRILVVFFDDLATRSNRDIWIKIWNAQFPIVVSDEGSDIIIYNGKILEDNNASLVQLQKNKGSVLNDNNPYSFWKLQESIKKGLSDKGEKSLNATLLKNLEHIIETLRDEYKMTSANRFVLRLLFIRYLIDRGVDFGFKDIGGNIESARTAFLEIVRDKMRLIALTAHLKKRFNGNLFETQDWDEVTEDSLDMLYRFLSGTEEMKSGQLLLFPFYDFNIIPIELVSCIYEILIGSSKQAKDKAYYTPEGLVDYMVDRVVGKKLSEKSDCRVLDPSCGSGIFLVKSLQRILEKNADDKGFIQDNALICELVENNIFGIDYNEEAVDVTIFSLYVTLLDYKNPKNLDDFRLPLLKGRNIFAGDFFDDEVSGPLTKHNYDAILGNPPWGIVKNGLYTHYSADRKWLLPHNDISAAFLQKVMGMGKCETECCLVMPSKMMLYNNGSVKLRKLWLESVQVLWVVELSSVREKLFHNAKGPSTILSFVCKKSEPGHKLEHICIKPSMYLKEFGIILIEPGDIKYVPQEMLERHDILWKVLDFGSYWDFELLESLQSIKTFEDIKREAGLEIGRGIDMSEGNNDTTDLIGRKILSSAKTIGHFTLNASFNIFNKPKVNRRRKDCLYEAPYVLVAKGVDPTNYSCRAVYSEEDFLYKDSVTGIKGSHANKDLLLNICGLMNSSLFSYFNLMLSSSVGIEREQFLIEELDRYPYAYSDCLVEIVREAIEGAVNPDRFQELLDKVDDCVLDMYGVKGNPFIDFALNIRIPEMCGRYKPRKCTEEDICSYADTFQSVWDKHFSGSGVFCEISIYPDIKGMYMAYAIYLSEDEESGGIRIEPEVGDDMSILTQFSIYKLNDSFFQIKNVIQISDNSIAIVKPNDAKYWHPAMAIKDSHKVINDILSGKGMETDL